MEKYVVRGKRKHSGGDRVTSDNRLTGDDKESGDDRDTGDKETGSGREIGDDKEGRGAGAMKDHLDLTFQHITSAGLSWKRIQREHLDLTYVTLLDRRTATSLVRMLEEEVEYFGGELAKVKIFGKWHDIPRKQGTYGDPGLTYKYSGVVTPARPWTPALAALRALLVRVTGHHYNFVLVNRYKDGQDKMGEHKDDEKELDPSTPIASLSLGQPRDFYFRHQDNRPPKKKNIDKVNLLLEHGSLLLMHPPTNKYWYHALPPRKSAQGLRINLTFRRIVSKSP